MDGLYNPDGTIRPIPVVTGARWAIGRAGINLIEATPVHNLDDPTTVLSLLGITVTTKNLDEYFPQDQRGRRRPTFALMHLWHQLGDNRNTNGSVLV